MPQAFLAGSRRKGGNLQIAGRHFVCSNASAAANAILEKDPPQKAGRFVTMILPDDQLL